MAEGPCLNPNCKSHGKPHPNCRCYGSFAKGGVVGHFCDNNLSHDKKCEHYTEDKPQAGDAHHSVSSYLMKHGLHGLLEMGSKPSDDSVYQYNKSIKHGSKKFDKHFDHLFEGGEIEKADYSNAHKSIEDWIDKGGIAHDIEREVYNHHAPTEFAEGGDVKKRELVTHDPHITQAYPEQNLMLQAAKGRMSNYLNSLKPQKNLPKLAFDPEPDQRQQKKSYKKAVEMAAHPLSILDKIKTGKVDIEDIKNLKNLHPEVDEVIQKKMTEKIIKDQFSGKKPSYKVRQGMSLFLGTPLSGEMAPQNILAAQSVFAAKKSAGEPQQGQPPKGNKKSTSSLTKSDDAFLTGNQARTARQQKQ